MTDRPAEIREMLATFERDGIDAALHVFHPEVHWASPPEWMDQSGYDGYDGLRELVALWRENFDDFGLTLEEIHQVGELWVVLLHQHGHIKGSGDEVRQKIGWVIEYGPEGLITRLRAYFSWAEALDTAAATRS